MASFDLNAITSALNSTGETLSGVDFTGKSLKLDNENDAKPITDAISACKNLQYLTLTGNTLGVAAAVAIAVSLEKHPEFKYARWADMFTQRLKTEIPPALQALGNGMINAGARLTVLDLSDNAFGPIGVEGIATLLSSDVCSQLQELRLNNNGLGISGARVLSKALLGDSPPRLKVFIAGRNRLENDGAKMLAEVFKKMGSLEEVAMPQNGIYHVGITALSEAFKQNQNLRILNLNDNTIGPKGAEAFSLALPNLKALKDINFGDCLLKSKGALALAKGFRESGVLLENLDLSHNEIGSLACLELVDAITSTGDNGQTLNKVILAGNKLGGAAYKTALKEKLGDCGSLSDDDDYESGSENESSEESDGDDESECHSEDSATEEAQHHRASLDLREKSDIMAEPLDTSGVEEVKSDVAQFLKEPTIDNLKKLGSNAAGVIDTHLLVIQEPIEAITAYVDAVMKVSGLCPCQTGAELTARALYQVLMKKAASMHAAQWALANSMLVALSLIKSEDKKFKIMWDLQGCYSVLSSVIEQSYFPENLRETLKFFIKSKKEKLTNECHVQFDKYPNLYS